MRTDSETLSLVATASAFVVEETVAIERKLTEGRTETEQLQTA